MRTTAGARTTLTPAGPVAQEGTKRRTLAGTGGERTVGGVQRRSLADVPGRDKKPGGERQGVRRGGWQGLNKEREQRTEKFPRVDVPEAPEYLLLRFAEDELFGFIYRHWIGKRPYTCIRDVENDIECPLCDVVGNDPKMKAKPVVFYNVIDVETCTLRVWEMTSEPTRQIRKLYDELAAKEKGLADPAWYVLVTKEKKDNGFFEFTAKLVKTRDLAEDYGVEPLTEAEIAEAVRNHGKGLFTDEIIQSANRQDLREAAASLTGDTDED